MSGCIFKLAQLLLFYVPVHILLHEPVIGKKKKKSLTTPSVCWSELQLVDRSCHLGYILRSDLSDTDDILRVQTVCRRANCLLSTFYAANPIVKTTLFHSFCLSLYGSALCTWRLSSSNLRSLEVTFNNLLRKIWKLPQ